MNAVLVLIDSLNRSSLAAYAPTHVQTPNITRFAQRAHRFDQHFVGSLPCMPARREIYAGRREMMWRPWGPLEPYDRRLPRLLEELGHRTAIVTDHYHYWSEAGNGYLQSFQSTTLVRGHETDAWQPPARPDEEVPGWVARIEEYRPAQARRYWANVRGFRGEEDYFPARVFTAAAQWLRRNAREAPFFLQVESFDVHEPFDVPEPYRSMYADGSKRDLFDVWPPYQDPEALRRFLARASPEEVAFVGAQYHGKLTMVDRWLGELWRALDELGLWEETVVVLTTDHGHDLGQRGAFGKQWPHYDSHANIPLLVHHPHHPPPAEPHRALTSTVDLHATLLEALGGDPGGSPHSRSLMPLLRGETRTHREALLYGTWGQGVGCTDGEWTVLKSQTDAAPLYAYTCSVYRSQVAETDVAPVGQGRFLPGVDLPQWRIPVTRMQLPLGRPDLLFHRAEDPLQERDLWDAEPGKRREMLDKLRALLDEEGCPEEGYVRLGLSA